MLLTILAAAALASTPHAPFRHSPPTAANFAAAFLQVGNPPLTVTVIPPAPGVAYSVSVSFGVEYGHEGWYGSLPSGAMAPIPASRMLVRPWQAIGPFQNRQLPTGGLDPTQLYCTIAFLPPTGLADLGGGSVRHNQTPSISAGPGASGGYTFTVGP